MVVALLICDLLLGLNLDLNVRATSLAVLPVFIFGLWDDYKSISPLLQVEQPGTRRPDFDLYGCLHQNIESPDFFIHGQGMPYIFLDWLLTIFWVVGHQRLQFVDSMDGLAVGLGEWRQPFSCS